MKILLILTSVLLLSTGSCFSQSDYREGYIITLANDTISGYINYKSSPGNLQVCQFRPGPEAPVLEYRAEEIQAFRIYGQRYYSSLVVERDGVQEPVFVEKLVDGIVDLFFFWEFNHGYYLMRTEQGELYKLKNSKIAVETDQGRYTKQKKEYLRMLQYLFSNSARTLAQIEKLPFKTDAMINIARYYHEDVCNEYECVVYTKEKKPVTASIGLYAGYSISTLSLQSGYFSNMNLDYRSSIDPSAGIYLLITDPDISERLGLQVDVIWQGGNYSLDTAHFTTSYIRIPVSLKYTFPTRRAKPALQLGIAYNQWYNFGSSGIIPYWVEGEVIQKRDQQYGLLIGAEVSLPLTRRMSLFGQSRIEGYRGRSLNHYTIPEAAPNFRKEYQEYVDTRTTFITFSLGLRF